LSESEFAEFAECSNLAVVGYSENSKILKILIQTFKK